VPGSGSTFPLDVETTVTCTATDAHDNTATSSFTVEVHDTTGPTLTLPAATTVEATRATGAVVTWTATANDIVDGALGVTCEPASGSTFALGATTVECAAVDRHSNVTTGTFSVSVVDTTAPALTLPNVVPVEATGPSGAAVTFTTPTASDVVDGAVAVTCDHASGSTFPLGTTTVVCSATDAHDNTGTGSFDVTVRDTTGPTLSLPSGITVTATAASGATATFTATAHDIVDGAVAVTCTPASGSTFPPGTTAVPCQSTDAHGNPAAGSFPVSVLFDVTGGLLPPVNPAALNTVKNGSTVPLKWQVPNPAGGYISSLSIVTGFSVSGLNCDSLSLTSDTVDFTTTGGTALRYDATANQYVQNWQTPKRAGTCWQVDVGLVGGQHLTARFRLK
jgi:hypothetical protein